MSGSIEISNYGHGPKTDSQTLQSCGLALSWITVLGFYQENMVPAIKYGDLLLFPELGHCKLNICGFLAVGQIWRCPLWLWENMNRISNRLISKQSMKSVDNSLLTLDVYIIHPVIAKWAAWVRGEAPHLLRVWTRFKCRIKTQGWKQSVLFSSQSFSGLTWICPD